MKRKFNIFEKDGARFRAPADRQARIVDHVQQGGKWVPYKGDRVAPAVFGDHVGVEEHEVADKAAGRRGAA